MRKIRKSASATANSSGVIEVADVGQKYSVFRSPTGKTLDEWLAEKAVLERDIAVMQKRLVFLHRRLRAAGLLIGEKAPDETTLFNQARPLSPEGRLRLIDAIERIANQSTRPISRAELRHRLSALGLPPSSFNNYFYTAINRLNRKRRITLLDDGSVWKALSPCMQVSERE